MKQTQHKMLTYSGILMAFLYLIFSYQTLTVFPFVHSDETWLGGLTRQQMLSHSFGVSEPFFNLYPRAPHAIKLLFHCIQMPFIHWGGYSIHSLRLVSLMAALGCLYVWFILMKRLHTNTFQAFLATFLLAFNTTFFYASHFARQEIWILLYWLLALLWFSEKSIEHLYLKTAILATSLWIHPNAVMIYLFLSLNRLLYGWDRKSRRTSFHVWGILCIAVFMVSAWSLYLNPAFIKGYLNYGASLGVTQTPLEKLTGVWAFLFKIFNQISATYYMPNVRVELILSALMMLFFGYQWMAKKASRSEQNALLLMGVYILVTISIGRYNTTSIVFGIVTGLYLLTSLLSKLPAKQFSLMIGILTLASAAHLLYQLEPYGKDHYTPYIASIKTLTQDGKTLGNLNMEMAFSSGQLLDFRNLGQLESTNTSIEDYLLDNAVAYVALPSEMAYIARNHPKWDILYGDVAYYYADLMAYLEKNSTHVGTVRNDYYSVRILRYIGTPEWRTDIYELHR